MANHSCVAIGINQYQFFQPLSYAQADAQALWQFLLEEAEWSPDQCLLLTDTTPPIGNRSAYPTRENLLNWIDEWSQRPISADDSLWLFFSGYGVTLDGEDYLMPSEGNPAEIAETGISLRSLFASLKESLSENILVLLDMNRSQGGQSGANVGTQTVELAKEMGIATVLSCQLDQFSHETSSLGHGLFTAVLLEGLRSTQGKTFESLVSYLRSRLPELSQHHWKPVQSPLIVMPSLASHHQLPTLPEHVRNWNGAIASDTVPAAIYNSGRDNVKDKITRQEAAPDRAIHNNAPTAGSFRKMPSSTPPETNLSRAALVPVTGGNTTEVADETPGWLSWLLLGGGAALLVALIGGVVLRNQAAFMGQQALLTPTDTNSVGSIPQTVKLQSAPYGSESQTKTVSQETQQQANQAVLDKARTLIVPNQASQFSQAIAVAQQIKPDEPLYQQAQDDIARWSGVILDLAEGRAKQGQFDKAMATAQLVPQDNQSIYNQTQQAMASWREKAQVQRTNNIIIQGARGLIKPGQASSYNLAIRAARKVPPNQPGFAEAQQLISQWSQTIYQTAQSRASQGRLDDAIQTAALVPENTPAYTPAQKAIVQWKKKAAGTK